MRRVSLALLTVALTGCPREDRNYGQPPFGGGARFQSEYQDNAYALAEGKRLYYAFNCNGCHGDGGGGIGPPLMDEDWLYGAEPKQVFESIHDGRPNGMPPWGGKLPDQEIWRLAAYVRSLSGLARSDAAPARWDHMQAAPAEADRERRPPRVAPAPDAGEHPK